MLGLGYATASYFGLAFRYTDNKAAQWRGPSGLAMVWSVIVLCALPFIPESPRFLLMHGRKDEAWKVVARLHASKRDPEQVFAREEFYQMQVQAEQDRSKPASWRVLLSKAHRKRVMLACGLTVLGQSTAVLVIQNYVRESQHQIIVTPY